MSKEEVARRGRIARRLRRFYSDGTNDPNGDIWHHYYMLENKYDYLLTLDEQVPATWSVLYFE